MIKAILTIYNSKIDRNGNVYWAFRWFDTITSKAVTASISGGESNISCIPRVLGLDFMEVVCQSEEMGIREFNRFTKKLPYAGCTPDELAEFIRDSGILAITPNPITSRAFANWWESQNIIKKTPESKVVAWAAWSARL